jgi:hypothetical protein
MTLPAEIRQDDECLQNSEHIIIAGRLSMGKTVCAVNIAQNSAVKDGKVVAVLLLAMPNESAILDSSDKDANQMHLFFAPQLRPKLDTSQEGEIVLPKVCRFFIRFTSMGDGP